jgi:SAM-dependent methyltransferase
MNQVLPLDFSHQPDQGFKTVSPFLKHILSTHIKQKGETCLDIPCGNGRNIFFLSQAYPEVTGFDREPKYLEAIMEAAPLYTRVPALLERKDILLENLTELVHYDLVCNIHFYEYGLLKRLIDGMKPGAYLVVETPNCYGGNFWELPTEEEITEIIGSNKLIEAHFKPCGQKANTKGNGSARILMKKI